MQVKKFRAEGRLKIQGRKGTIWGEGPRRLGAGRGLETAAACPGCMSQPGAVCEDP